MKTKPFFIILECISLLFLSGNIFCQPPDSLWEHHYGGASDEIGFDAIEDQPGEYIIVGKTKSYGHGLNDGYLLKLDNNGGKIWEKYYGGAFDEQLISICPAHSGGYAMTGFFKSLPGGETAVWVLFINGQGDSVLSKTFRTQHDCWGLDIYPTPAQGYIVSGVMATGFGVGDEIWLLKLDNAGDTIWTRRFGRSNQDYGEQVIQTSDGGYIIAGRTYSSYTPESCDAWVIKTDAEGDTLWTGRYGGADEDMFNCVLEIEDGYIFAGNAESYGRGYAEFWAVRTDDNGDTIWSRTYGNDVQYLCFDISETAEGNYVLAGYAGLLTPSFDTYLLEIDPEGNQVWEASYGHPEANEIMYGFSKTTDGGFIAAGHTTYFSAYKDELVVLKLGPGGSGLPYAGIPGQQWMTVFPNPMTSSATIRFDNPDPAQIIIEIDNILGMPVKIIRNEKILAGRQEIPFNAEGLPPGVYIIRMTREDNLAITKIVVGR